MRGRADYSPYLAGVLAEAGLAYRRREDDRFQALLGRAIEMAPRRLDLRFALANDHLQAGRPDLSLEIFRELGRLVPDDAEVLFHLAYWSRFAEDRAGADAAERRLAARRPERAADLDHILRIIDAWLSRPAVAPPPEPPPAGVPVALVVFGYRLNPDGGMHPFLVSRLEKTLAAARRFPEAVIVASGGVPAAGRVEAVEMRRWLVARGVPAERIIEEGYARDLAENVLYSRQILAGLAVGDVICVVSAAAARRAGAGMEIAGWSGGASWRRVAAMVSDESAAGFVDDGSDRLKLYRDALRIYGIPLMRIYPELAEL